MNISKYEYVNIPELVGDIAVDVNNLLIENSKKKTLEHVIEVANTNCQIASKYGLDKETCLLCGYLHDISAIINPKDMLDYMMENHLFIDEAERKYPFLLHQRISRLIAKNLFNIEDENILSAIECHTTLKANPTKYDMALFIADKISWDQEGKPPFYDVVIENLSFSLEAASLAYINFIIDNGMILHPHSWLIEGKEYLEKVLDKKDGKEIK